MYGHILRHSMIIGCALALAAGCGSGSDNAAESASSAASAPSAESAPSADTDVAEPSTEPAATSLPANTTTVPPVPAGPPVSVLFVGNSFTFFNQGIGTHFSQLAASTETPHDVTTSMSALPGYTLKYHREEPGTLEAIRAAQHDVVVLQDDIPEYLELSPEPFEDNVRWFDQEIRTSGARPVLFMAWPYERLGWATLDTISKAHADVGSELDVPVAPVATAFALATQERPDLPMISEIDKEHPSRIGTYLAAAVLYATIFEESPEGATYVPASVDPEDAMFAQRIAWQAYSEWQA